YRIDGDRVRAAWALHSGLLQREIVGRGRDGPAVLPAVVLVGHELAIRVDAGADLGKMGGAVLIPAVLVPAHELHAHRLADRLRQDRGGLGGILVATAPERARALVIFHA